MSASKISTFTGDQWSFQTPSRAHKIEPNVELEKRNEGVEFLQNLSHQLRLRYTTLYTAVVYFHFFYFRRSLVVHPDVFDVAASCLYLATKVQENRRRLQDIVETSYFLKRTTMSKADGHDKGEEINPESNKIAVPQSEQYTMHWTQIVNKETILLQTLEFRFDHPVLFDYLPPILKHWHDVTYRNGMNLRFCEQFKKKTKR
ncbi:cyclin Pch1 [Reticulomyxa filosa]|uniref:Cyclin Pch1 n=1 Tax=Reticulomyxa filosa TaxID=46433 RepID=X6P7P3_RETFI|nr:cyclin Pch1 [Reticulomyxa filosa]|eukprot:ETO34138.1 cyclin Pch1 [Reticulomyxa filosa]